VEKNSAILILLLGGLILFAVSAWQGTFLVAAIGCGIFGGAFSFSVFNFLTSTTSESQQVKEQKKEGNGNENTYVPIKV
jgi:hypothetical protein